MRVKVSRRIFRATMSVEDSGILSYVDYTGIEKKKILPDTIYQIKKNIYAHLAVDHVQ